MAKQPPATPGSPADDRTPFLKVSDVKSGDVVMLTGFTRRLDGRFSEQIAAEVMHMRTGRTFDWAFKVGSEVHRRLFKQLGRDENKWRGSVTLTTRSRGSMSWIDVATVDSDEPPFDPADVAGTE